MTYLNWVRFVILTLAVMLASGCGYHVAGHADLIPAKIQTIAIPAFDNLTTRYKLADRIPENIAREFIQRTRYRVVSDPNTADAVLHGSVTNYVSYGVVTDQSTGRASVVQLSVFMQLSLVERETGKVLYTRNNFETRQRYEISTSQTAYFEESDIALERLSQDVARTVVSAILEAF